MTIILLHVYVGYELCTAFIPLNEPVIIIVYQYIEIRVAGILRVKTERECMPISTISKRRILTVAVKWEEIREILPT